MDHTNAIFSADRKYRYLLERIWDKTKPTVLFICMNPSIADEKTNDPTATRCINFAKSWGFGSLVMMNLYAYVDTYQNNIWSPNVDSIGTDNDTRIIEIAKKIDKVVVAWGSGVCVHRAKELYDKLCRENIDLWCFKKNKNGMPAHPLYQRKDTVLIKYKMG
ncbi:DUF1643 domain-containing protein [Orbaceae bacterium ac157xtp]